MHSHYLSFQVLDSHLINFSRPVLVLSLLFFFLGLWIYIVVIKFLLLLTRSTKRLLLFSQTDIVSECFLCRSLWLVYVLLSREGGLIWRRSSMKSMLCINCLLNISTVDICLMQRCAMRHNFCFINTLCLYTTCATKQKKICFN